MGMGPNPRTGPGQVRAQSCLMTLASLAWLLPLSTPSQSLFPSRVKLQLSTALS